VLLAAVSAVSGCAGATARDDGRLRVVATTTVLADLARNVAGPDAHVAGLLRPNSDPHSYEPRPDDVRATADGDVVLESGKGLDGWMDDVVEESGSHGRVVDVGARAPGRDPHWWHDPRNAATAVREIERVLAAADPAHRSAYARRAAAYEGRLRALDRTLAACFARVPRAQRKLVTDHDAFGYFARRYGLRVVGAVIPSQSTQAQSSARDLARLRRTIEREHVAAVFPESSLSGRVARALARDTGARSDLVLYGDALGPADSAGATYLSMEAANADAMVRGFTAGRARCRVTGVR